MSSCVFVHISLSLCPIFGHPVEIFALYVYITHYDHPFFILLRYRQPPIRPNGCIISAFLRIISGHVRPISLLPGCDSISCSADRFMSH